MEITSKFSDLYKLKNYRDLSQEKRRLLLLAEQKKLRAEQQDSGRNIKDFIKTFRRDNHNRHKTYKQKYEQNHRLQLSEWLKEKPDNLDQWYLIPCPKGVRCLVIATDGCTEMYNKAGRFVRSFNSMLPGDGVLRQQISILDCIFVEKLNKFFILDAIALGNQELINCDTEFRLFWINSKFMENDMHEINDRNEYEFVPLNFYNFEDEFAISSCLQRYPQWEDNSPELDGFLFYHKESSYVYGNTPLVGWLFPFMIPEVLQLSINDKYLQEKPENYVNYMNYINVFDENLAKKKNSRHWKKRSEKMDQDVKLDEDKSLIDRELELEMDELGD